MKNGKLVGKEIKTPNNVYVFSKMNEAWLWNKRLDHINFNILIKVSKLGYVRGLLRLSLPDNSIFK